MRKKYILIHFWLYNSLLPLADVPERFSIFPLEFLPAHSLLNILQLGFTLLTKLVVLEIFNDKLSSDFTYQQFLTSITSSPLTPFLHLASKILHPYDFPVS